MQWLPVSGQLRSHVQLQDRGLRREPRLLERRRPHLLRLQVLHHVIVHELLLPRRVMTVATATASARLTGVALGLGAGVVASVVASDASSVVMPLMCVIAVLAGLGGVRTD
jgi:hypothetical protein